VGDGGVGGGREPSSTVKVEVQRVGQPSGVDLLRFIRLLSPTVEESILSFSVLDFPGWDDVIARTFQVREGRADPSLVLRKI
jgi:hypothetical protein